MVSQRAAEVLAVLDQLDDRFSGPAALLQAIGVQWNWPPHKVPAARPECFDDDMADLQRLQRMLADAHEALHTKCKAKGR